ncbi:MAG: hypothetical protein AAF787_16725 [Chloroflexota bacterium]
MPSSEKTLQFPANRGIKTDPRNYEALVNVRTSLIHMEDLYRMSNDGRILTAIDALKIVENMYRTNAIISGTADRLQKMYQPEEPALMLI